MSDLYTYNAEVIRVIDGDTIRLDIDLGLRVHTTQNIRVLDVDTPELRSKNINERQHARDAKAFARSMLPTGKKVKIETHKAGKYGRWLANIFFEHTDGNRYNLAVLLRHNGYQKRDNYDA